MNSLANATRSRAATTPRQALLATANAALAEMKRIRALGAEPQIETLWVQFSPDRAVEVLAALAKADIQARFDRGERPEAASYLARFATLRDDRERVVSLVFEEFCLREERGERPEPEAFCDRYEAWRDSLLAQLCCHDMLSQAIGATTPTRPLPCSGDRFRSFRLGPILGEGGSARVFLANDESLGDRRVALKVSADRGKEPAIQGRLDHANIVPVLSVTDDPETGFRGLCMPYRAGLPLDKVIRRIDPASRPQGAHVLREILEGGPAADPTESSPAASWHGFPDRGSYPQGVAWVVAVVARALAHAHGRGVYHRDVKPANVLLAAREGPQLLDFNLSHAPHDAGRAEAALRGGTLPYMAPEQLNAFLDPNAWDAVGEAADIYSLGLLLRELLTGERPESPDPGVPLPRAIHDLSDRRSLGFGPVRSMNRDVPHALEAILTRCLAFRPEDRYSSARALAEDLERFVARQPLLEAANPSHLERTGNWARRRRVGRVSIIALSLIGFGFVASRLATPEDASNAGSHVAVAMRHFERSQWKGALADADKALRLDPTLYTAHQARSKALFELNRPDEALFEATEAVRFAEATKPRLARPLLAAAYLDQATLLRQMNHPGDAKAAYGHAIELVPDCHTAHAGLGIIAHNSEQKYLDARRHFAKAISFAERAKTPVEFSIAVLYARNDILAQVYLAEETHKAGNVALAKQQFTAALSQIQGIRDRFACLPADEAVNLPLAEARARKAEAAMLHVAEACARIGLAGFAGGREDLARSLDEFQKARDSLQKASDFGGSLPLIRGLDESARDGLQKVQKALAR